MLNNYHTHTARCGHAIGEDEQYVVEAIRHGIRTLGFADHAPIPVPAFNCHPGMRMPPELIGDYVSSLLALREKYKNEIGIKIGFEVEYLPSAFPAFLDWIAPYPIDYLLLGEHYVEDPAISGGLLHANVPNGSEEALRRHTALTVAGIHTRKFAYVAHPDVMNFTGSEDLRRQAIAEICRAAAEEDLPVEINLLGLRTKRTYPCQIFFEEAAKAGAKAILGIDAHEPAAFAASEAWEAEARRMAEDVGLPIISSV